MYKAIIWKTPITLNYLKTLLSYVFLAQSIPPIIPPQAVRPPVTPAAPSPVTPMAAVGANGGMPPGASDQEKVNFFPVLFFSLIF